MRLSLSSPLSSATFHRTMTTRLPFLEYFMHELRWIDEISWKRQLNGPRRGVLAKNYTRLVGILNFHCCVSSQRLVVNCSKAQQESRVGELPLLRKIFSSQLDCCLTPTTCRNIMTSKWQKQTQASEREVGWILFILSNRKFYKFLKREARSAVKSVVSDFERNFFFAYF